MVKSPRQCVEVNNSREVVVSLGSNRRAYSDENTERLVERRHGEDPEAAARLDLIAGFARGHKPILAQAKYPRGEPTAQSVAELIAT
jgi:hypothetical protein